MTNRGFLSAINKKDWIGGLVLFLLLLSMQLVLTIKLPFATGGKTTLLLGDILLFCACAYLVIWRWMIQKKLKLQSRYAKGLLIGYVVMGIFCGTLIIWRIITHQSIGGNFMVTKVLVLGVVVFYFIDVEIFTKKAIFVAIPAFFSAINLLQVLFVAINHITFRRSTILGNINVYNTLILVIIPLMIFIFANAASISTSFRRVFRFLFWGNFTAAWIVLLLSGSRISFLYLVVETLICFVAIYRGAIFRRLEKAVFVGIVYSVISAILIFGNIYNVSGFAQRSMYYPLYAIQKTFHFTVKSPPISDDTDPGEVIVDAPSTTDLSNALRSNIQNLAKTELKSHWVFGTGRPDVMVPSWGGYLAAHNFLLEWFLAYGVFGGLICVGIYLSVLFCLFSKRVPWPEKICALTLFFGMLLISWVQPILTTKLLIVAVFWIAMGIWIKPVTQPQSQEK